MQVSSLLLVPDRSICTISLSALPDEALMGALIDGLTSDSKRLFAHEDGTPKDACKWTGVKCRGIQHVTEIEWKPNAEISQGLVGSLNLLNLPASLQRFCLIKYEYLQVSGLFDTNALPHALSFFILHGIALHTEIDLRRLPPELEIFGVTASRLVGRCCLTSLPRGLRVLVLRNNQLEGSISLDRLPKTLSSMNLSKNFLLGTLNLKSLPPELLALNLSENEFAGEIDVEYLPSTILEIFLNNNKLSGILQVFAPPNGMEVLDVTGNAFRGPAVVSRVAMRIVTTDFLSMNGVVTPEGTLYSADDIALWKKYRVYDDEFPPMKYGIYHGPSQIFSGPCDMVE